MAMKDTAESCGSRAGVESSRTHPHPRRQQQQQQRHKLEAYAEVLRRLRKAGRPEVLSPSFEDGLLNHFNRLPERFKMELVLQKLYSISGFYLLPFSCSVRPRAARYIPVQQLTGTWTACYRAVPSKSTVGGRLKEKSTIDGRLREKSIVGGQLREKKGRRRRRSGHIPHFPAPSSPARRRRPRVVLANR
ncbi:hypothetical protein BHM03_00027231 [Ensete ventricosum]|nr:hypothetical protein BHM03_00027231 [Ensete ventricosum]